MGKTGYMQEWVMCNLMVGHASYICTALKVATVLQFF